MIKIICPVCGSDDIQDIGEVVEVSVFRCDNCDAEFQLNISMDTWEFDNN